MTTSCIALLGRKDQPTDAVEEYCRYLCEAMEAHNIRLELRRVPWEIRGWPAALDALRLMSKEWRGTWVLVQYTALAWSARGFPSKFLRVLYLLKSAGARVGIVFHDVEPYPGMRLVDRFRRVAQIRTMRRALFLADLAIFTVPQEKISWVSSAPSNIAFIPVGPNLPIPENISKSRAPGAIPTIGVFSITGGEPGAREIRIILSTVRYASQKLGKVRLSVFGRNAEHCENELRFGLSDLPVELSVAGVLEPDQIVEKLSCCDVLLFVRGPISSRRSSAIAGIACGLPVIAYPGTETAKPITEAGVVLVSPNQANDLNSTLVRILSDVAYRTELAARSRGAYQTYFSWPTIAARLGDLLKTR